MIYFLDKLIFYFLLLIPIGIITGPFLGDLFLSLSSIGYLLIFIIDKKYFISKNYFIKQYKYIFFIIFFWLFYLIFSSILSSNILFSFESSLFHFRFGVFVLCLTYAFCNFKDFFNKFLLISLISYIFVFCDGIFQFLFNFNTFGFIPNPERISGIFSDELIMGSYLARLFPLMLCFFLIFINGFKYQIIYISIFIILVFIAIFLSAERVAMAIFILSIILFFLLSKEKLKIFIYLLVSFCFIFIFTKFLSFNENLDKRIDLIEERLIHLTFKQIFQDTNQDREPDTINIFSNIHEAHFLTAYNMFKSNIFFGVGPKNFRILCDDEKYIISPLNSEHINEGCSTHPHNLYVHLLSETGIIGFTPIIILYLLLCYNLLKYLLFTKILFNFDKFLIIQYSACICMFVNFFPFLPSGSLFNNWLNIIFSIPIALFVYSGNAGSLKNN